MKLMTEIEFNSPFKIEYTDQLFSIGSCFAENIGQKFFNGKFKTSINPFGILFNPISICEGINRLIQNNSFLEEELFSHNDIWQSWMHHSCFSHPDKDFCLHQINHSFSSASLFLKASNYLIITLGTSFVYQEKKTNQYVANCHKVQQNSFQKIRITQAEIFQRFSNTIQRLQSFNSELKIIFTVSPVRHIKDGLLENKRSKSILLLATEQLCDAFDHVYYFPSYEIQMDELRDYRFYNSDLIHPNESAIEYIWEKFRAVFFSEKTNRNYKDVLKIAQGFQHKILHKGSKSHQSFLERQIEKSKNIMKHLPVDFNKEIHHFEEKLKSF